MVSKGNNILLDLEFDGTGFCGWQQQRDQRTVQGVLLEHLQHLFGESVELTGAGRTDRGVHALHMPATFNCEGIIPEERLLSALRSHLPGDIHLLGQRAVPLDFNARFSACRRSYRYMLSLRRSVFTRNHAWFIGQEPEIGLLNKAAERLRGRHDFSAFCKSRSLPESAWCDVAAACWLRRGDWLFFQVTANRFLHHMVRGMVGLMLAVCRGEVDLMLLEQVLETGNRQLLPLQAPPHGLYLTGVEYPAFTIGEVYLNEEK